MGAPFTPPAMAMTPTTRSRQRRIARCRVLGVAVALLLCGASARAQTNRGEITGTVRDTSGAVVPGVTVVVTNLRTNHAIELITSSAGVYAAVSLDPVEYRITAELAGFK